MLIIVWIFCARICQAAFAVDIHQLYSPYALNCLKTNQATSLAIVRGFNSVDGIDPNVTLSLNNLKSSNISSDVYFISCRSTTASAQVNLFMNSVPNNLYGGIWVHAWTNSNPKCSWQGYDATSNCNFVIDLLNTIKTRGKISGVYTSSQMWSLLMGNSDACSVGNNNRLWYVHLDQQPNFLDFTPFGGWSSPSMKQYRGQHRQSQCNTLITNDYYE